MFIILYHILNIIHNKTHNPYSIMSYDNINIYKIYNIGNIPKNQIIQLLYSSIQLF